MIELPDAVQMREADRLTIATGLPGIALMRRAGGAVAERVAGLVAPPARVLVLCGPGNNGGDGFVVARLLGERGFAITLELLGTRSSLSGDAKLAAAEWGGPLGPLGEADPAQFDLCVDALFGTGLTRDLSAEVAAAIARVNASGQPIVAVDVPSGVDADTGRIRGAAICATHTVTFARRKPGLLLYPGRGFAGRIDVADIGIGPATIAALGCRTFANAPSLWERAFPRPRADGHKYDKGHVLVLSGGASHTGAARLSARGALRAGAGLVSLACDREAMPINAAQVTAIMLRPASDPGEYAATLEDARFNGLVLGPGLGVGGATPAYVRAALSADRATVLDADALTSFAGDPAALVSSIAADRRHPVVLTPHEGEFKRLFGETIEADASKLERARQAATWTGAILVLKGADTVIAAPDGRAAINGNAAHYLGTAGSGDVLCGFIAALLAQGMPGFEAAAAAVWLHAEVGRRFGPGLIAEDLPDLLPPLLREVLAYDPALL